MPLDSRRFCTSVVQRDCKWISFAHNDITCLQRCCCQRNITNCNLCISRTLISIFYLELSTSRKGSRRNCIDSTCTHLVSTLVKPNKITGCLGIIDSQHHLATTTVEISRNISCESKRRFRVTSFSSNHITQNRSIANF